MRYIFCRAIVYIYTLFIFIFSVLPVKGPAKFPFFDKIVHLLAYAGLSFLVVNALLLRKGIRPAAMAFSYAFFVGLTIEIIQLFIPYRSFALSDIATNSLGSFLGILLRAV
jgi:VanZ family protein